MRRNRRDRDTKGETGSEGRTTLPTSLGGDVAARRRVIVIVVAIAACVVAILSLSTGMPWSSAADRPVGSTCVLSAPTAEAAPLGASGDKVVVTVGTTAHNDGPSPMPKTMLRVSLVDGGGEEVAILSMDTGDALPVNGSELVSGQVALDRDACMQLSAMRVSLAGTGDTGHVTELDTRAFDRESSSAIQEAAETIRAAEGEQGGQEEKVEEVALDAPSEPVEASVAPQASPQPAYSPSETDFSSAFVIGDSILAFCRGEGGYGDKLGAALPGIESDVESGRYFEEDVLGDPDDGMIDIARRVAGRYRCYVVECGINDAGLTPAMAREFVDVLGGEGVRIYFVNQRVVGGADGVTCSTVREVAEEYDNVYEIDWNSRATGHEGEYFVDICHPNETGADALVTCIREVLTTA